MQNEKSDLLAEVADYYQAKIIEHGPTPQGVDWNGEASQFCRFEQLSKLFCGNTEFSVNDLGCGYGAFSTYLSAQGVAASYIGIDISEAMVEAAVAQFVGKPSVRFLCASAPDAIADYSIASGIFNVRMERTDAEWQEYLEQTLDVLDQSSKHGFAFNCLTSYSDEHKKRDYLYYANPGEIFDLCKRKYSRHVALLHDYGLYEFTILVRKTL
ncbi:class I SAM-dependent methyltransferase [Pseudomonas putida]